MLGDCSSFWEGTPSTPRGGGGGGAEDENDVSNLIRRGPRINVEVNKAKMMMDMMLNDTTILDAIESRKQNMIPNVQKVAAEVFETVLPKNSAKLNDVNERIQKLREDQGEMRESIVDEMPSSNGALQNIVSGMNRIFDEFKSTENQHQQAALEKGNEEIEMGFCDKLLEITNEMVEIAESVDEIRKVSSSSPTENEDLPNDY